MSDLRTAAQQALEALEDLRVWRVKQSMAVIALRAALAQQDEPAQEQDVEDAIEAAYWHFDARKKGLNEWAYAPQSERDAFKAEARKLVRGYFPTRQAQDTKREMLAVADAFIRGKRAALAQQEEPVQKPVAESTYHPCTFILIDGLKKLKAWDVLAEWDKAREIVDKRFHAALAQQEEPETIDEAMQQPRAMAQAYENGYKAGAAAEREAWPRLDPVITWLENGCDPAEAAKELRIYAAAIRARGTT